MALPSVALCLLTSSFPHLAVNAEELYFDVFQVDTCTGTPLMEAKRVIAADGQCETYTYTSPTNGEDKTNAEDLFNCCENFIEFMQYAGTSSCGDPNEGKWIYNIMSTQCDYVLTSNGDTWQKLKEPFTRCSARHDYEGKYASLSGLDITDELCNNASYSPFGGSWEVPDNLKPEDGPDDNPDDDGNHAGKRVAPAFSVSIMAAVFSVGAILSSFS